MKKLSNLIASIAVVISLMPSCKKEKLVDPDVKIAKNSFNQIDTALLKFNSLSEDDPSIRKFERNYKSSVFTRQKFNEQKQTLLANQEEIN